MAMTKLQSPLLLRLLGEAVDRDADRIFLDPVSGPPVRFSSGDEPSRPIAADEVRREIDDLKATAGMPIRRDRASAGQVSVNEDRFAGTILVLTEPAGDLERCELRLRLVPR